ncbi:AAA family ATPase [Psychrobacter sp. I-STPA10]|uniref:AAA family ATPase n=1 Tax=Psychrobacter sp. I-STPA10 TaxID=2585769 RepID=UPI001E41EC02|nr:AAA family ATPase [Psychrobacter sp. I-STPA10]
MKILHYNALNGQEIPNYDKVCQAIADDDFGRADVKKIGENLYRAKLNRQDRLLFALYQYQSQTYALMLEWIKNHDYASSRFLNRGARIDEDLIEVVKTVPDTKQELTYVNPTHQDFAWLGKCISFDDVQYSIYQSAAPLVIIGSAGSGKTALMLEKIKRIKGKVLYVSLSAYLVKNAQDLYHSNHYSNDAQQVDFFSYQELLESIHIPSGNPVDFTVFRSWFLRHRQGSGIDDAHKLFEEFRGVLTSTDIDHGYLSYEDYHNLGIRESIYLDKEREQVYQLFEKYLKFVGITNTHQDSTNNDIERDDDQYYDTNLVSHVWLNKLQPTYDFVVVDEVQDFTNIQLYLILRLLRQSGQFLLCGDANQIVHPNFFSWKKVKSLFYQQNELQGGDELIRILHTNYRNAPEVTNIANRILQLKNLRFGSIDKESHYLVNSNGQVQGQALLWQDKPELLQQLNQKTHRSTQYAVIVLHDSQKTAAKKYFNTPLIFSIQEAKGLEYENVILYNFVSVEQTRFSHISEGIEPQELDGKELNYSRNKDKADKSLEVYKFYINALYVALTRAIKNVYWIEKNHQHPLFNLLKVSLTQTENLDIQDNASSIEEWQLEAQKLAMQGKTEQAEQICHDLLQQQKADWIVYDTKKRDDLLKRAVVQQEKKAGIELLEYAQVYDNLNYYHLLKVMGLKAAQRPMYFSHKNLLHKHFYIYSSNNTNNIEKKVDQYGIEYRNMFNRTPVMNAVWVGNAALVTRLVQRGADIDAVDNQNNNALQIALKNSVVSLRDKKEHDENYLEGKIKYAQYILPEIYDDIAPASISLQIKGQLVKLEQHLMEYLLVHLMLVMLPNKVFQITKNKQYFCPVFTTADILQAIKYIPSSILPEYRRKRAYIGSVLSKNEASRDELYNRRLFYRVNRGEYILYPKMKIKIKDKWVSIIDIEDYHIADKEIYKKMLWMNIYDKHLLAMLLNANIKGLKTDMPV